MIKIPNKEFWREQHEIGGYWLSNTKPIYIYDQHDIKNLILYGNPINIMDVGIGNGDLIKELVSYNHNVIAVDICENALNKVENIAKTYLVDNLSNITSNSIDLCICHLVFQHNNIEIINMMIREIYRILKVNGIFTFQIAFKLDSNIPLEDEYTNREIAGIEFIYTTDQISNMIESYNIIRDYELIIWKDGNIGWKFIKIQKE